MHGKLILSLTLSAAVLFAMLPSSGMEITAAKAVQPSSDTEMTGMPPSGTEMTTVQQLKLEDGLYQADAFLSGGSGRASVTSPARITVKDGEASIRIEFSSPYYDYMITDGVKYEPVSTVGENSVFEVPLPGFDFDWAITADTTAMSEPHEIEYTLRVDSTTLIRGKDEATKNERTGSKENHPGDAEVSSAQNKETFAEEPVTQEEKVSSDNSASGSAGGASERVPDDVSAVFTKRSDPAAISGLEYEKSLALYCASGFRVDYYQDGFKYITISNGDSFLVVPEGQNAPSNLPDNTQVIKQPADRIYLAATSAMDDFRALNSIGCITLSGEEPDGWYMEEAREAMQNGSMLYAGKYSAPDYERIVSEGCNLAIESTMIYHVPEVREQLLKFGIPVLVERSSYETQPLGRAEWIKLYGALLNKEEEASEQFEQMVEKTAGVLADTSGSTSERKTVAYFSISTSGYATVRKTNDYISQMISMAGGRYIFQNLGENESALSTVKMQMEDFYTLAKDADYIIYNSAIEGEIKDIDSLLEKAPLLEDFRAIRNRNAWCMVQNVFQKTTAVADMIVDFHTMLTDPEADTLTYMYRLQ